MARHKETVEVYDDSKHIHRAANLTVTCPEEAMDGLNLPWLSQVAWDKDGSITIEIKVEKLKR